VYICNHIYPYTYNIQARQGDELTHYGLVSRIFWCLVNPEGSIENIGDIAVQVRIVKSLVRKLYKGTVVNSAEIKRAQKGLLKMLDLDAASLEEKRLMEIRLSTIKDEDLNCSLPNTARRKSKPKLYPETSVTNRYVCIFICVFEYIYIYIYMYMRIHININSCKYTHAFT
jgi:hypothetical protein